MKQHYGHWNINRLLSLRLVVTSVVIVVLLIFVNTSQRLFFLHDVVFNTTASGDFNGLTTASRKKTTTTTARVAGNHQMHEICYCRRAKNFRDVIKNVNMSTCDAYATSRGHNQTVVSYSFYGNVSSEYFLGIRHNAVMVARMYPGYVMRVYHDVKVVGDEVASAALCGLWCDHDHVDLCDVRRLPAPLYDQHHIFGMIWRFFVLGDPLVNRFLIRDTDSDITQREVDSVQEWINEGMAWHIMRDHPYHGVPILGGMWGGMNRNLAMNTELRALFINRGNVSHRGYDQILLANYLWPIVQDDMVSHDSYTCKTFRGARPWPSRRYKMDFVGDKFPWYKKREFILTQECPVPCRPQAHKDWKFC